MSTPIPGCLALRPNLHLFCFPFHQNVIQTILLSQLFDAHAEIYYILCETFLNYNNMHLFKLPGYNILIKTGKLHLKEALQFMYSITSNIISPIVVRSLVSKYPYKINQDLTRLSPRTKAQMASGQAMDLLRVQHVFIYV